MKRWIKSAGICGGVALALAFCVQAADTRKADADSLRQIEKQWNQDFVMKNVDTLLAHYATDAVLMAPGIAASSGTAAIRKILAEMVADPAFSLKFQSARVEVAKSGDLAYTQGSYQMTMTDPHSRQVIHDRGTYVTTYRKQADGSWKAVADIATSEMSPGAPTSAVSKNW